MRKTSDVAVQQTRPAVTWETTAPASGALDVNVLFTDTQSTAAALQCAASCARDLKSRIRLRACIVVPWQLSLDRPQASVSFTEQLLQRLVEHLTPESPAPIVQLYVCRNWVDTLAQVLQPHSLVVIGGRKRWWPTQASRLARALRSRGHRVVLVNLKRRAAEVAA